MILKDSEYWNTVGQTWNEDLPDPLWRAHSDAVNSRMLASWLPAEAVARILKTDVFDEICGEGLVRLLTTRARSVIGIDIAAATLAAARSRNRTMIGTVADVRRLPFADGLFDVIVSTSTLDHFSSLAELENSLRELWRVLKPGGQLLLTLDNPLNPCVALRNCLPFKLLNRAGLVPYFVGATAGPRRLRRMLEQAGFIVKESSAILHCPRVLAVTLSRQFTRRAGAVAQRRFLVCLMAFERLARLPTRFLTGHFVAMRTVKTE